MSQKYQELYVQYQETAVKAKRGDRKAAEDKARMMNDLREMERESNRVGTILNPVVRGGKMIIKTEQGPTKSSLQEEYVRSFDDKVPVDLRRADGEDFRGTLREYHSKRLLGR